MTDLEKSAAEYFCNCMLMAFGAAFGWLDLFVVIVVFLVSAGLLIAQAAEHDEIIARRKRTDQAYWSQRGCF